MASTVAPPAAHSCRTIAAPSTGSADSVASRPSGPRPGASAWASGPDSGPVRMSTGRPMSVRAPANSRMVRRAPGSTRSGTDVRRRLWLKTPNVVYTAKATKKPSVLTFVPNLLRYRTAWIADAAAIANVASDIARPARASLAAGWLGAAGALRAASAGVGGAGVAITPTTGR